MSDERKKCPICGETDPYPAWFCYGASMAWSNSCKIVFYGTVRWPSYSYWMVPGTVTDIERAGWR